MFNELNTFVHVFNIQKNKKKMQEKLWITFFEFPALGEAARPASWCDDSRKHDRLMPSVPILVLELMEDKAKSRSGFIQERATLERSMIPHCISRANAGCLYSRNRDRGNSHPFGPPTPPNMRIRIRQLGGLSKDRTNRGGSQS